MFSIRYEFEDSEESLNFLCEEKEDDLAIVVRFSLRDERNKLKEDSQIEAWR